METINLTKQKLSQRDSNIKKSVLQSTPAFILESARQSLKQLDKPKIYHPLPKKRILPTSCYLFYDKLTFINHEITLPKPQSPLEEEAQDLLNQLALSRAQSALEARLPQIDTINLINDKEGLEVKRRSTMDSDRKKVMNNQESEKKIVHLAPVKASKIFIIKHKKSDSMESKGLLPHQGEPLSESTGFFPEMDEKNKDVITLGELLEESTDTLGKEKKKDFGGSMGPGTNNKASLGSELEKIEQERIEEEIEEHCETKENGQTAPQQQQQQQHYQQHTNPIRVYRNRCMLKDFQKTNRITSDVKLGEIIGEGAYGKVYKSLNMENGNFVAVKQIEISNPVNKLPLNIGSFCNEIEVYQSLQHEHVVKYLGAKQEGNKIYIYMEYMPGGSMSSMLKQYGCFEEKVIRKFTKQIVLGLDYLHKKGIVHRDVKGANILSDGCGNVKLGDFGAAKHIEYPALLSSLSNSEGYNSIKGSLYWMAPELLNQDKHGRKIDIWSLGCTVIEMASACHPWPRVKSLPELVIAVMTQKCPPIPDHLSETAKDFIRQCCQFDKKLRPKISDLLNHPFLNEE